MGVAFHVAVHQFGIGGRCSETGTPAWRRISLSRSLTIGRKAIRLGHAPRGVGLARKTGCEAGAQLLTPVLLENGLFRFCHEDGERGSAGARSRPRVAGLGRTGGRAPSFDEKGRAAGPFLSCDSAIPVKEVAHRLCISVAIFHHNFAGGRASVMDGTESLLLVGLLMTMERFVPLRVFLLCFVIWSLLIVAFGWAVKSTLTAGDRSGILGKAVVEIASFPTTAKTVLLEVTSYASGSYRDEAVRVTREGTADYSGFVPVPMASGIDIQGLIMRADPAEMAMGWRLLIGAFTVDGEVENAALLMSPDLEIVRTWILDEVAVGEVEPRPKYRKIVHGLEMLNDGSLIFTFDGSISLQRIDACGERQWATVGNFHHAVTLDDTGEAVWTFSNDTITQVAIEDGSVLRQISMDEVIAKNPTIDILEIRRDHPNDLGENSRNTVGRWMADPFHLNDVDPLPAAIADRFDGFDSGDLLVSARSLNLLFVIDPDTLEVKWWRVGAVQRQHDPDWLPNGEIMVLNNRMSRDFSEIVSINPGTLERTTVLDGRENDFYTRIRGKHQLLDSGSIVVTSPQQGRAFEVNRAGDVVFEIVNLKPDSDTTNYVISEMKWLPMHYFDVGNWECQNHG